MIRSTHVKYFSSSMAGAPVLTGTVGAFTNLLDACLVNGFGAFTPTSIAVLGGVATLTCDAGHLLTNVGESAGVDVGVVIRISGATGAHAGLNLSTGWRVTVVSPTVLTWECGAAIPDGTVSGTLAALRAPAGMLRDFTDTNRRAYRFINPYTGAGILSMSYDSWRLQVEDAAANATDGARVARLRMYEAMSSATVGSNPVPTTSIQSLAMRWVKSAAADSTPRAWALASDGMAVYFWVMTGFDSNWSNYAVGFPSAVLNNSSATYPEYASAAGFITGCEGSRTNQFASSESWVSRDNLIVGCKMYLGHNLAMSARSQAGVVHLTGFASASATKEIGLGVIPITNSMYHFCKIMIGDTVLIPRGFVRGLYECQNTVMDHAFGTVIPDITGLPPQMMSVRCGATSTPYKTASLIVDLEGPWGTIQY